MRIYKTILFSALFSNLIFFSGCGNRSPLERVNRGNDTSTSSITDGKGGSSTNNGSGNNNNQQQPLELASLIISENDIYDFGTTYSGSTIIKTFTVTNKGRTSATQIEVSISAGPYSIQAQGCYNGSILSPDSAACTIEIRFAPTSVGTSTGSFTISYQNGATQTTAKRSFKGTAINEPVGHLSLSIGSSSFGSRVVGAPLVDQAFIFINDGNAPVSNITMPILNTDFVIKNVGSVPNSLAPACLPSAPLLPGSACFVVINFVPTLAPGLNSQVKNVSGALTYNNGRVNTAATASIQLAFSGTALSPALIAVGNTAPAGFQGITATPAQPPVACVSLKNNGGETVTSLKISGIASPFAASTTGCANPSCGGSILPGATCDIAVSFNPSTVGNFSTPLTLSYNDGVQVRTQSSTLTGSSAPVTVTATVSHSGGWGAGNDCMYLVDASGNAILLGCNYEGNFTRTVSLKANPGTCNSFRMVMTGGQQDFLHNGATRNWNGLRRDTASALAPNGQPEMNYFNLSKSGNTISFKVNDNQDTSDVNHYWSFQDYIGSITFSSGNFTIQNSSLACN